MAKSDIYIKKIEKSRTVAVTGFRFKQALYNAVICCHREQRVFPYGWLIERYAIPTSEEYLTDGEYYLLTDDGLVLSERPVSDREAFLRTIADKVGGHVVFTSDRQPVLTVDGWVLNAVSAEGRSFDNAFVEDFSVPYELYPRIINIAADRVLVEIESGVCEWKSLADAGIE